MEPHGVTEKELRAVNKMLVARREHLQIVALWDALIDQEKKGFVMPKKTREELLHGLHRGKDNHLDETILEHQAALDEEPKLRAKFEKVSFPRLAKSLRAANAISPAAVEEAISLFEKNLGPFLDGHGL